MVCLSGTVIGNFSIDQFEDTYKVIGYTKNGNSVVVVNP